MDVNRKGEQIQMGRQFKAEAGDYSQDVTRFRERVPDPSDNRDLDSYLASAYAAQAEHDLNVSQVDRAGKGKAYQNIEDVCDHPGKTADSRRQHVMPDVLPRRGR